MRYFLPYVYGVETRAKSVFYKLSFAAYILLPNFLLLLLYYGFTRINSHILDFVLAFTAMYGVYEIGYFQNDTFTVRIEQEPTHRLNRKEREFVDRYILLLISSRIMEVAVLVWFLHIRRQPRLPVFITMLCILYIAYAFYNSFRNRSNIIAIFFVLIGKYCAVPVLFIPIKENIMYYVAIVVAIPLYRTVEMTMASKRYGYNAKPFDSKHIDRTRMMYYLIMLSISAAFLIQRGKELFPAVVLFGYLFLFRLLCFMAVKNKRIIENRKKCLKVDES